MEALSDAISETGYDQVTWLEQEFEGWAATLSIEPGTCMCGGTNCFCCDPINITAEVAHHLATMPTLFTVTNPEMTPTA